MNIKINPFRQARQPDPTPRGNVTTSGNTVAGHERFRQSKFDVLPSRKKKTISTQPTTEKQAPSDWKASRTFRNAAKLLKKVFYPCGSSQSKLRQATTQLTMPENELITPESEPIKQFAQFPPPPAPADNRAGVGTKNSAQTGTVTVNGTTIILPKRKESLAHFQAHSSRDEAQFLGADLSSTKLQQADTTIPFRPPKSTKRPSIPAFRPTEGNISSKQTAPATPPRPPKSNKRPSGSTIRSSHTSFKEAFARAAMVQLATQKMETASLRKQTLIFEGWKTASETGHWLPVEHENHAPPAGLRKSDKDSAME
ncbi:hypothetical protein [Mycetohabitans rhizoxinica]|uniref:hypothetical protein n=1 Tax=Mycetohabitans rhizoxinica TaxID=412963 RepID=UPI0030D1EE55